MQYRVLGQTGISVSRLCFGALTIGPLQANLSVTGGARVIRRALEQGVNFIDTAELYQTYPYIREAIKERADQVVICTKCYAYTRTGMQESVEQALAGIGRDYIDIFMLHEQESGLTIKGHWEAIEYLLAAKKKGQVRAIGLSTHHIAAVRAATEVPEIDVIHPIINVAGVGIQDGGPLEMLAAIKSAVARGKGVYGMKALGGGNLLNRKQEAFDFALSIDELASFAVGMQSIDEVDYNVKEFNRAAIPAELRQRVERQPRRLHIDDWCQGCGTCVARCGAKALRLVEGKAVVDPSRCRLCGYCGAVCPEFCIKVV